MFKRGMSTITSKNVYSSAFHGKPALEKPKWLTKRLDNQIAIWSFNGAICSNKLDTT